MFRIAKQFSTRNNFRTIMCSWVFVICIILTVPDFINSFQQSSDYVHVYNYDNLITTKNILSEITKVPSLSSCSAMCRKKAETSSFFYNSAIKKCLCTGDVEQSDLLPFAGYVHFSSSELSSWKVFGKSQYLHIKKEIKWLDAQIECQNLGAKLAEIETLEENIFLKNITRKSNNGNTIIGGTDAFSQNRWRWSTTFKPITFSDWAPNKPDASGGDECLCLTADYDMAWDDWDCDSNQASFMCERIIV